MSYLQSSWLELSAGCGRGSRDLRPQLSACQIQRLRTCGLFSYTAASFLSIPQVTRSSWKAKDKRMTVINELFQNIRFLKVNGWQTTWSSQARAARETELQWRVKQNAVDTITSFICEA
jgi:hypothetical protein